MRFTGLWQHSEFMKLWVGETISLMGSQITLLALPLTAALILRASPQQMGILTAAETAPFLLIGLFAGVWVDRLRRRSILMTGDIGRALLLGSIPVAAFLNVLRLEQLYVVSFLVGILTVFFDVAYQSYLPSLVEREHLVEGNSKLEVSRSIAQIVGPGLAGTLMQIVQAPLAITLDALSFLVSAWYLWRIKTVEPAPTPRVPGQNIWQEIGEGLGVVFGNPLLRSIAGCTATSNLFGMMQIAVFILFVTRELNLAPAIIGVIFSVGSIGALLGAASPALIAKRVGLGWAIIGSIFLTGLSYILIPLAPGPSLAPLLRSLDVRYAMLAGSAPISAVVMLIVMIFMLSFFSVVYNVNQVSLRQTITPHRLQGRMNATMRFLVWGTMPIGSLIGGFLGGWIGLRSTLWIAAAGSLLAFVWVALSPVRTLREQPAPIDETGDKIPVDVPAALV